MSDNEKSQNMPMDNMPPMGDMPMMDPEGPNGPNDQMQTPEEQKLSDSIDGISEQLNAMNFVLSSLLESIADYSRCSSLGGTDLFKALLEWQTKFNDQISQAKDSLETLCQQQMQLMMAYEIEIAASKNPGDYLVVEDRTKTSTYHLQVKRNGKPDHNLMGGAWAALHGGYRGNKYEGPQKQEAIKKLKALYKREGMATPAE
jgi:hypothetical protein